MSTQPIVAPGAKSIVLLGSTGSIGTQTLDVADRLGDRIRVAALAGFSNIDLLEEQARRFRPEFVCAGTVELATALAARLADLASPPAVVSGVEGMCEVARLPGADLVVVAVAGAIGILPTHAAIRAGKDIALASKEVLVAAGAVTMELVRQHGVAMLPIDSEHSAIFQCLQGVPAGALRRVILTASGGPFRSLPREEFRDITLAQALRHPTWTMGGLVTINSATLMNKALETIEARWLFDVPIEAVEVAIHPQSIVHSMIGLSDGSVIAQLGLPDMRLPIQYTLVYPDRIDTELPRMEISDFASLTFEAPDEVKFPALALAREAVRAGGTMPAVMNAANEMAVGRFLKEQISYLDIIRVVKRVMNCHDPMEATAEAVLEADAWARRAASEADRSG